MARRVRIYKDQNTGESASSVAYALRHKIEYAHPTRFYPHPSNTNEHSKKQSSFLKSSVSRLGFINPVLVNDSFQIIAGHLRVQAALELELDAIPFIRLSHLSAAELRVLMISDNKIASLSKLNDGLLAAELSELLPLLTDEGFDICALGMETAEIDLLLGSHIDVEQDPDDAPPEPSKSVVTQTGEMWIMGDHVACCGDAKSERAMAALMDGELATVVISDPPYNLTTSSFQGRGKIRHGNFVEAFGEMSSAEFIAFLTHAFKLAARFSRNGALHYYFGDWRHIAEYVATGKVAFTEFKHLIVWTRPLRAKDRFTNHNTNWFFSSKVATASTSTMWSLVVTAATGRTSGYMPAPTRFEKTVSKNCRCIRL